MRYIFTSILLIIANVFLIIGAYYLTKEEPDTNTGIVYLVCSIWNYISYWGMLLDEHIERINKHETDRY